MGGRREAVILKSCGHPERRGEAEVTCPMLLIHFEFKVLKKHRREKVWDTSVSMG